VEVPSVLALDQAKIIPTELKEKVQPNLVNGIGRPKAATSKFAYFVYVFITGGNCYHF
jgi:hypothetical protein